MLTYGWINDQYLMVTPRHVTIRTIFQLRQAQDILSLQANLDGKNDKFNLFTAPNKLKPNN